MDRARAIAKVCEALTEQGRDAAAAVIAEEYPFVLSVPIARAFTEQEAVAVFVRDGFIDRYSGQRLVFPGTLRLIAVLCPAEFPFHPNWKVSETHRAFWELFPTVDHIVPVTRGAPKDPCPSNWATTSMSRNSEKGSRTLEELPWSLFPPGEMAAWDGQLRWFLDYTQTHPEVLRVPYLRRWHRAAHAGGVSSPPPNRGDSTT